MIWLVEKLTAPDALVCDPFCGSGTTGAACRLTGRRFVGIEIEERYCTTASRRIEQAEPLWAAKDSP
jgi:DNA modification methylase